MNILEKLKNITKIKGEDLDKNKFKTGTFAFLFCLITSSTSVYANTGGLDAFSNFLDFLVTVSYMIGAGGVIFGIFKLFEGFQEDNAAGKSQGLKTILGGIALIAMEAILAMIGITW